MTYLVSMMITDTSSDTPVASFTTSRETLDEVIESAVNHLRLEHRDSPDEPTNPTVALTLAAFKQHREDLGDSE